MIIHGKVIHFHCNDTVALSVSHTHMPSSRAKVQHKIIQMKRANANGRVFDTTFTKIGVDTFTMSIKLADQETIAESKRPERYKPFVL